MHIRINTYLSLQQQLNICGERCIWRDEKFLRSHHMMPGRKESIVRSTADI